MNSQKKIMGERTTMSKFVLAISVVAVVLFSMVFAFANEHNESEEQRRTAAEVEVMHTSKGAQMRLLQLEYQIAKNAEQGESLITQIKTNQNTSMNVSTEVILELEGIVESLKTLRVEVRQVRGELLNETKSASDAAAEFVILKRKSVSLTSEFRIAVATQFTEEERAQLRASLRNDDSQIRRQLASEIKQVREEIVKDRLAEVKTRLSNEAKVRLEKANLSSRADVAAAVQAMEPQERKRISEVVAEDEKRREIVRVDAEKRSSVATERLRLLDQKLELVRKERIEQGRFESDLRVKMDGDDYRVREEVRVQLSNESDSDEDSDDNNDSQVGRKSRSEDYDSRNGTSVTSNVNIGVGVRG
jgi:hypothetical protein